MYVLQSESDDENMDEKLFDGADDDDDEAKKSKNVSDKILSGKIDILLSHPESLLSDQGRKIMKSPIYCTNVVACVVDEAHCVEMW